MYSIIKENEEKLGVEYAPFTQKEWNRFPFATETDLKWFRDAKYGLFFHVGISALGKVDIGWSRQTHKAPDPGVGIVPDEVYDSWAEQILIEDFNAEEWIQLARDGGMKYVVIITKHHDGFHMWDTDVSDYKITNAPFGRDYLKEIIDACHKYDMKIGLYFSQRDWVHPDYQPIDPKKTKTISPAPFWELNEGEEFEITETHKKYIDYMHKAVLELVTRYDKIDILWWDSYWYAGMFRKEMWDSETIEQKVKDLQPHILINNRASTPGDFDTPEGFIGMFQNHRPWETCMPLGPAWAWTGEEPKSFKQVLHQLLNCVCGDGNYLLSIGAMPNGDFDQPEKERIRQVGRWLKAYGESVYSTRGGPWKPGKWGGSCYHGKTAYLHILEAEGDELSIPIVDNIIQGYECLTGETVKINQTSDGIQIIIDRQELKNVDLIIKLTMEKPIVVETQEESHKVDDSSFADNPAQYGTCLFSMDEVMTIGSKTVELPTDLLVTGFSCHVEESKAFELSVSEDNVTWHKQHDGKLEAGRVEIQVNRYDAGAFIVGKKCRFLKIESPDQVAVHTIKVFGFQI